MKGYYDGLSDGKTLTGWAFSGPGTDNCKTVICVYLNSIKIGQGNPKTIRMDVIDITEQPTGFIIECSRPVRPIDIISGNFTVIAKHDTCEFELCPSKKLTASMKKMLTGDPNLHTHPNSSEKIDVNSSKSPSGKFGFRLRALRPGVEA